MSQDAQKAKLGAGHASAMFRQGVRELRAAVYPESNVAQPAEYGTFGTKTPGEVAQDRRADARDIEHDAGSAQASALEQRAMQAEARADRTEPDRPAERDRDC
ncbi:hypothetical protein AB1L88_16890 [Tautonia sp. JC769]|uniref:hypothetical protein n=1 Tax=Tautonia sp. JC769 TaxID=3232135 RepID=UPI003459E1D8